MSEPLNPSSRVLDLVEQGQYDEAVDILRDKLSRNPESASLRQQLADVLAMSGERKEAVEILEKLAVDYLKLGLSGKAVAVRKKIERLGEGDAGPTGRKPEGAGSSASGQLAQKIRAREDELLDRSSYRLEVDKGVPVAPPAPRPPAPAPPPPASSMSTTLKEPDGKTEFMVMPVFMEALAPQAKVLVKEEILEPLDDNKPSRGTVAGNPLFRDLPEDDLAALIEGMKLLTYESGDIIMTEGEPGDSLFIVTTGRVKAFVLDKDGRNHRVRQLSEGSFFGEVALLTGRPRTATVVASQPSELLKLDRATLQSLTGQHPGILRVLHAFCATRMNSAAEALVRRVGGT